MSAERVLRAIYYFVVALVPLGLSLWYYRAIGHFPHEGVYFTYTDALFFISDALMLMAVLLWLSTKFLLVSQLRITNYLILPSALCLLSLVSILWSRDWRTSLFVCLHILLIFLFILSLRDWRDAWRAILLGFCAALSIQVIGGIVGFMNQSTAFLAPLHLNWPGPLDPTVRGAIIVQLPGGESFLRAYGTLPHPNILGGFVLIFLLAPIAFFLRKERPNDLALLILIPGVSLLALTFSRSAWLALILLCMVLVWKSKYFPRRRVAILLAMIALSFVITLFPYRDLVRARTVNTTSHSEEFSLIGRAWLNGEARTMVGDYPLTGVGIGSFIIELARRAGEGYVIEPVHNIFLLAGAELGIPGLLLVIGLSAVFAYRLIKTKNPNAILAGAILTGLGFISLFDHYLWTLAPGRLILGLMIGLFVGQDLQHDA